MKRLIGFIVPFVMVFAACGITPRPRILSQADAVAKGDAAQEAKRLAPQAFIHAERLRQKATQEYRSDDLPAAQILSERAIAAYNHAFVLARLAKAEKRREDAREQLLRAQKELARLDEQQQRVATEADDLEMRIKMVRDLEPLAKNEPASPKRERARLEAARSLAVQAQLLCTSARLLNADAKKLGPVVSDLGKLREQLAATSDGVPIDEAIRLRSACLEQLTLARRDTTLQAPAAGAADELLAELGRAGGLFVFRDDRGVVVTLRDLFARGAKLTPVASSRLEMLGRVAKAHPDFPLLVVVHGVPAEKDRARAVVEALEASGAERVEHVAAGDAQPVVDPGRRGARERNVRVEIVFVAPAS